MWWTNCLRAALTTVSPNESTCTFAPAQPASGMRAYLPELCSEQGLQLAGCACEISVLSALADLALCMHQRKASATTSSGMWLDHTITDKARHNLSSKSDQVQIAQAHLSCCIKDHEQLQRQLQVLQAQIISFATKRKDVSHCYELPLPFPPAPPLLV